MTGVTTHAPKRAPALRFHYRNYRGEVAWRDVRGDAEFWFGVSPHHEREQWFLSEWDYDKAAWRDFAVVDILEFESAAPKRTTGGTER
jgi:hypothetical protein